MPAGIGVLAAVFIVLLSPTLAHADLLAALLALRAIHALAPLMIASLIFVTYEAISEMKSDQA